METVFLSFDQANGVMEVEWAGQISRMAFPNALQNTMPAEYDVLHSTALTNALRKDSETDEITRLYLVGDETVFAGWKFPAPVEDEVPAWGRLLVVRKVSEQWQHLKPSQSRIRVLITLFNLSRDSRPEQWTDIESWIAQIEHQNRTLDLIVLRNPSRRRLTEVLLEAEDANTPFHFWHYVGAVKSRDALNIDNTSFGGSDLASLKGRLPHLQALFLQLAGNELFVPQSFNADLPLIIYPAYANDLDFASIFFKAFYQAMTGKLSVALLAGQRAASRYGTITHSECVMQCLLQTLDDDFVIVAQPITLPPPGAIVRDQVFISYSHDDQFWCDQLMDYLDPLRRNKVIKAWFDHDITAGSDWKKSITDALDRSKVAVLLVSGDFFRSRFIINTELSYLIAARERGECTILWVAVRAYPYELTVLRTIQAVHDPIEPLDRMDKRDAEDTLIKVARLVAAGLK